LKQLELEDMLTFGDTTRAIYADRAVINKLITQNALAEKQRKLIFIHENNKDLLNEFEWIREIFKPHECLKSKGMKAAWTFYFFRGGIWSFISPLISKVTGSGIIIPNENRRFNFRQLNRKAVASSIFPEKDESNRKLLGSLIILPILLLFFVGYVVALSSFTFVLLVECKIQCIQRAFWFIVEYLIFFAFG